MRDRLPLLAFAGALVFAVMAVLMLRASDRGEFAEASSTYRSEPDGARALFLLAQEAGLKVTRRNLDLESLEGTPELVLLGVEGPTDEKPGPTNLGRFGDRLSSYEIDALMKAVERGATVVYAVARQDEPLLRELGLELSPVKDAKPRRVAPFSPGPLTEGVATLDVPLAGHLLPAGSHPGADGGVEIPKKVAAAADVLPVLVDLQDDDLPIALLVRHGKGRVLVLSAPALASNAQLGQGDDARFWLDVLGTLAPARGSIAFDEYHHGFTGERSMMGYAARYGVPWAIAQVIFALALWLWATRRLGDVRAAPAEELRSGADSLLAMARIYQLGGHRAHAAQALLRGTVRALHALAGPAAPTQVHEIIASLEAKGHTALAAQLRDLDALARRPELDEPGLLELARKAAQLRAHVLATQPSDTPSGKEAA